MSGRLSVCATPIGNLADITLRVLQTLKEADCIAAEDTRHTKKLLNYYEIETPLISYHQHNERERGGELVQRMREGAHIALVSDAGMPAISDPGRVLVQLCHEEGIPVTVMPGACAFVTAVALSGLPCRRFIFEGFPPPEKKEQTVLYESLREETRTVIFYEAPHRLLKTLDLMGSVLGGERRLMVARELTKRFEELRDDTIDGHRAFFAETEPKGEFVLLLEGVSEEKIADRRKKRFEELTVEEHMALYASLPEKEAMKRVAMERGMSKRELYALLKTR